MDQLLNFAFNSRLGKIKEISTKIGATVNTNTMFMSISSQHGSECRSNAIPEVRIFKID